MQDRAEYIKFKEYALDNKLSTIDVRNMTKQQAAAVIDISPDAAFWSGGNIGFFINLRENIAREVEDNIITPKIGSIRSAIEAVFPDAEYTVKKRQRIVSL